MISLKLVLGGVVQVDPCIWTTQCAVALPQARGVRDKFAGADVALEGVPL